MILDKMYTQNEIIGAGMQASILRNEVITNNIANNDVPGYKKKTVEFEDALQSLLESPNRSDTLDIKSITPRVKVVHEDFNYRLDGNNVDVESEMVDLYQNSIRYDAMTSSIISNGKRISLVLTGR